MFILDRTTGKPIYDVVERPVAKGDVPGEWYSPTQPIPVKPPPVARVSLTKDDIVRPEDTTPAHSAACNALWESTKFYNSGPYTPWLLRNGTNPPSLIIPGLTGGPNWGGSAYDPSNGFIFINSKDTPVTGYMDKNARYNEANPQGQLPYARVAGPAFSAPWPPAPADAPAAGGRGGGGGGIPCFQTALGNVDCRECQHRRHRLAGASRDR